MILIKSIIENLNNRCFGVEKSTLEVDVQDALIELINTKTSKKYGVIGLIANINNEQYI